MTTLQESRAASRAALRERLRDEALDAARVVALSEGWSAVRMGRLADAIGTSRQSVHAVFGTKEELGVALVRRETQQFFDGVALRLDQHPGDVGAAVEAAVGYALAAAAENPLLQSALAGPAAGGNEALLPLLTSRSAPLLDGAIELFDGWVAANVPELSSMQRRVGVESTVRLLFSHVVAATNATADAAHDVAWVATTLL